MEPVGSVQKRFESGLNRFRASSDTTESLAVIVAVVLGQREDEATQLRYNSSRCFTVRNHLSGNPKYITYTTTEPLT
jgi:hypothetical protein